MKSSYRPDIDGLRAIAVLSVLFYHAGIRSFSGGYIGVDVFFVISGYFITGIIAKEIKRGDFSLIKFYERRIRRIYPALFSVIAFTLIASLFIFDSAEYLKITISAISITIFLSNLLFWKQAGYFEAPSTQKPLLHTWSLSVEEQFYIFFPLLMMLTARFFKSKFKLFILIMLLASLGASIYGTSHYNSANFYFMPLRAWELLTGSFFALIAAPVRIHPGLRNFFSLAGAGMILASSILLNDALFHGLGVIFPVCGSALVIYSGMDGETIVGKVLSLPVIVFVGRISYSIYLWHWPLLVMGKYYLIRDLTSMEIGIWVVAIFGVSILSWKFIENPFRERSFLKTPQVFALGGSAMLLSIISAVVIVANQGFPGRFSSELLPPSAIEELEWAHWQGCMVGSKEELPSSISLCNIGFSAQEPTFLVWGDSHASAVAPAIDESAQANELNGYISSVAGCAPLLGIDHQDQYFGTCNNYNNMLLDFIKTRPEIKTIILVGRWAIAAEGTRYKAEDGLTVKLVDMWTHEDGTNAVLFELGLNRTVTKLLELNRNVIIVTDVPELGFDISSLYSISPHSSRDAKKMIEPSFQEYLDRNRRALDVINIIMDRYEVNIVDPSTVLCDKKTCHFQFNRKLLYHDDDHLSIFGAHFISHLFDFIFEDMH